jgi:hypothetical protein
MRHVAQSLPLHTDPSGAYQEEESHKQEGQDDQRDGKQEPHGCASGQKSGESTSAADHSQVSGKVVSGRPVSSAASSRA